MNLINIFLVLATIAIFIFSVMVFHKQPQAVPDELITDTAYSPYDESKMPLTAKY